MVPSRNFSQELMRVDKICGGGGMTTTITTTLPNIHLYFVCYIEYTDYCAACKTHHHHLDRAKHGLQLVWIKFQMWMSVSLRRKSAQRTARVRI